MSLKSLASLIAGIGVGMSGYAQGRAQFQRNERDKRLADRDDADYERRQAKMDKADKLEADLAASQADQAVEDVPSYDISSMSGGDPTHQPAVGYKANGQVFADRTGAEQALVGVNSQSAKDKRAAAVLRSAGQLDKAREYEKFAQTALDEGTDQILGAIQAAAPSVDDIKKAGGKLSGTVGQQAADVFNAKGGRWNVSPNTMIEHFITKDAAGREIVDSRVVGKDGKPVVDSVRGASLLLTDMKTRMAAQQQDTQTYQTGQQIAETGRHNRVAEAEAAANNQATRAQQAAQLGIQQQRLTLERQQFKKQTLAGQIAEIETATGVKLSTEEKKAFAGIGKGKTSGKSADELTGKIVADSIKTFQENNPSATPQQIASYRAQLESSFGAVKENAQVEAAVREEFSGLKPDSPQYAAKWALAREIGLDDAALGAMGYKPPTSTVTNPFQQTVRSVGAIPSAPKQKIWVGNDYVVNPAYTEWNARFGDAARRRDQSNEKRIISAYERAPK